MNWGLRIILGLALFMLFIIGSVIYMISQNKDTMDDADYYEKGLMYDDVYDMRQNLRTDHAQPNILVQQDTLNITFTAAANRGFLLFKRPSDSSIDKKIPFYTQSETFKLPVSTLQKGQWQLEITWENNKTTYLSEHNVFLK